MRTDSLIEVVQGIIDTTGTNDVPLQNRTKPLSGNGSGHVSQAFREYPQQVGTRHIPASPYHTIPHLRNLVQRHLNKIYAREYTLSCNVSVCSFCSCPNGLNQIAARIRCHSDHAFRCRIQSAWQGTIVRTLHNNGELT